MIPRPARFISRLATITATIGVGSSLAADIVVNNYLSDSSFAYIAYDMPDFDQQRLGDLPNNGVCYCVPASSADLLAYAATHGYPEVDPGVPFLFSWESQMNYDAATAIIDTLGDEMSVSSGAGGTPCGATGTNSFNALVARIGNLFDVTYDVRSFSGGTELRLSDIAARNASTNAIGMISYGRYRGSFNADGDFVATSRPGGHRVAVNAAIAGGGLQILGTRDPWAAEGTDDQQEAFRTNFWSLTEGTVSWSGNAVDMDLLGQPWNSNTRIRALEGYTAIAPKSGFTWDPFTPSTLLHLDFAVFDWNPGWAPPVIELPERIRNLVPMPGNARLVVELEDGVYIYDRATAKLERAAEVPEGPIADIGADRFGSTLVAIDKQLAVIGANGVVQVIDLPGSADAIAMADPLGREATANGAPSAHVLMGREGLVATVIQKADGRSLQLSSFPAVDLGPDARFIVAGERALLLDGGQLTFFKRGGGFEPTQVEGAPTFPIIDVSLDGDSLVVVDQKRKAHAYRLGDVIQRDDSHPMNGKSTRGRIARSTSSTSATPWNDPDSFSTEEDLKIDQEAVDQRLDCRADLNADGIVDGADMGILFGSWGAGRSLADINRDGTVDSSDLGLMLGAFGACP